MMYAIGYGFGQVLAWLLSALFVYAFVLAGMSREARRRQLRRTGKAVALVLWAVVAVPALALLWVVGRFDGIEDRRRDWQLDHARQCRQLASEYRGLACRQLSALVVVPATVTLYAAHADLLDRLADEFDADAGPTDDPTID